MICGTEDIDIKECKPELSTINLNSEMSPSNLYKGNCDNNVYIKSEIIEEFNCQNENNEKNDYQNYIKCELQEEEEFNESKILISKHKNEEKDPLDIENNEEFNQNEISKVRNIEKDPLDIENEEEFNQKEISKTKNIDIGKNEFNQNVILKHKNNETSLAIKEGFLASFQQGNLMTKVVIFPTKNVSENSQEKIQLKTYIVKCELCDETFKQLRKFEMHMKANHECHLCKKLFKVRDNLWKHIKIDHKGLKNYKCDICEKMFRKKSILKIHTQCAQTWVQTVF